MKKKETWTPINSHNPLIQNYVYHYQEIHIEEIPILNQKFSYKLQLLLGNSFMFHTYEHHFFKLDFSIISYKVFYVIKKVCYIFYFFLVKTSSYVFYLSLQTLGWSFYYFCLRYSLSWEVCQLKNDYENQWNMSIAHVSLSTMSFNLFW